MPSILSLCQGFRSRGNYLWGSMLGIAAGWGWANSVRESLAEGHSLTQSFGENSVITLIAALGILLWTTATWQRLRCIGTPELVAAACTAALAVLWGCIFYLRMRPILALGLLFVVPLPPAIASAESDSGHDAAQDSPENS